MKNKNGFTLVELLVSISILALIMLIAIPAYNKISEAVNKSQRKSVISYLENAASKYAFDTGDKVVFVDTLIQRNYVSPDNENDEITDPTNNKKMNCYKIEMTKKGDSYEAKFVDENYLLDDGSCDESVLKTNTSVLAINAVQNGSIVSTSDWLKGEVTLEVDSNSVNINCSTSTCLWTSTVGDYVKGTNNLKVTTNTTINAKYMFQITTINSEGKKETYSQYINLKLDNQGPQFVENEFYHNYQGLYVEANDYFGVGVESYAFASGYDSNICFGNSVTYQTSYLLELPRKDDYVLCVKDKLGNIGFGKYNMLN